MGKNSIGGGFQAGRTGLGRVGQSVKRSQRSGSIDNSEVFGLLEGETKHNSRRVWRQGGGGRRSGVGGSGGTTGSGDQRWSKWEEHFFHEEVKTYKK